MTKMNRNIKLSDELYDWLLENARVRETFDKELKRLLRWTEK